MTQVETPRRYQELPPLAEYDARKLEETVDEFGILMPAVHDEDGNTIDGHNRESLAASKGIPMPEPIILRGLKEEQKVDVALVLNGARRQMSHTQSVPLWRAFQHRRKKIAEALNAQPDRSDRDIARELDVSNRTVTTVRHEMEQDPSVQLTQTTRPHQRTDQTPTAYEPDHKGSVIVRVTFEYSADSDEVRTRKGLDHLRESKRYPWDSGRMTLQTPTPDSAIAFDTLLVEVNNRLRQHLRERPWRSMLAR